MIRIIKDGKEYGLLSWNMEKSAYSDTKDPDITFTIQFIPVRISPYLNGTFEGHAEQIQILFSTDKETGDTIEKIFGDVVKIVRNEKIIRGKYATHKINKEIDKMIAKEKKKGISYVG